MNKELNQFDRILITGGAGFIGSELIRKIISSSSAKIFNLDKLSYASDHSRIDFILDQLKGNDINRYRLLKVDLSDDRSTNEAIECSDPDLIIHLAAETHVDRSIEKPLDFIKSNINGTFNLLESAKQHWERLSKTRKENFKYLHISTDEVFGSLGTSGSFDENSKYAPRSPYSASKAASDHLTSAWFYTYGFPSIITNCSNNFGPWQYPEKLIPMIIIKSLTKKNIPIYGEGKNIRDWLYVEEHVDALIKIALHGEIGEKYCIGAEQEKTNLELALEICEVMDRLVPSDSSYKELISFVEDRPGHDNRYSINSNKIQDKLGWKSKYNFTDSLEKTIFWYIENQLWCKNIVAKSDYNFKRIGRI